MRAAPSRFAWTATRERRALRSCCSAPQQAAHSGAERPCHWRLAPVRRLAAWQGPLGRRTVDGPQPFAALQLKIVRTWLAWLRLLRRVDGGTYCPAGRTCQRYSPCRCAACVNQQAAAAAETGAAGFSALCSWHMHHTAAGCGAAALPATCTLGWNGLLPAHSCARLPHPLPGVSHVLLFLSNRYVLPPAGRVHL